MSDCYEPKVVQWHSIQRTGLCAGMGFEKRPPGTAADWKTNVQDKLQKFSDVCQARAEADSEQMPKLTKSCHACTKPHVSSSF